MKILGICHDVLICSRPLDRRRCLEALTASAFNLATTVDRVLAH
jgi:hypothetical protein